MKLFDEKLSALKKGSVVRLTQTNGQVIEGVVMENDGEDALSLSVTASVVLRYSQIVCMEEYNIPTAPSEAPLVTSPEIVPDTAPKAPAVTQPEASVKTNAETAPAASLKAPVVSEAKPVAVPAKPAELPPPQKSRNKNSIQVLCDENDIKNAFSAMESDARKQFNPAYGKIQSALKSHETSKFAEASSLIWNIMEANEYEENAEVNHFYAYACIMSEEYREASLSFYYAMDLKNAFLSAWQAALKNDDVQLYALAAAFAALYITGTKDGVLDGAVDVITYAAEVCKDVTGFEYLLSMNPSAALRGLLFPAFGYLSDKLKCQLHDSKDPGKCIADLKVICTSDEIITTIQGYAPEEDAEGEESAAPKTVPAPEVKAVPETKVDETLEGEIIKYKFYENGGTITGSDGKAYLYELRDISDAKLKDKLSKITKWDRTRTIPVRFKPIRRMAKDYAGSIVQIFESPKSGQKQENAMSISDIDALNAQGSFEEALEGYKAFLDTPDRDQAFFGIIQCCITLWNKNGDFGYSGEIERLIAKYGDKVTRNIRNIEAMQQYYMKAHHYSKCLEVLNELLELCDSDNYSKILHCLTVKERCYRHLEAYSSAVSQLKDWLEIVKKHKLTDRYKMRDASIYPELAELYLELNDLENAEKYALLSGPEERKNTVLSKIEAMRKPEESIVEDEIDDEDEIYEEETAISLQDAYNEYTDDAGLEQTGLSDVDIADKLSAFNEKQLYCLLAWLKAAMNIVEGSSAVSALDPALSMKQAVQSIGNAFSYAYQSPLTECEYTSSHVIAIYESTSHLIPQYHEGLLTSAVMRTLFTPSTDSPDYYLEDLIVAVESTGYAEKHPVIVRLLNTMKSFYETTGCAINSFAGYRSNANILDNIISEAKELCFSLDQKNDIFESHGQVRRLRELMFSSDQSELRKCLNIVAENRVSEYGYVHDHICDLFIRKDRVPDIENTDSLKIDAYIDKYWDNARDVLISLHKHIARPHDKVKGGKRTNIVNTTKKILACICEWLAVVEHTCNNEDAHIRQNYVNTAPQMITMLGEIISDSKKHLKENGFNWGIESIRYTADELLSKINGTYSAKARKYMFIGFLSGEDILLNDDYLPELQSTFCSWGRMNILSRIERHAAETHPSFEERIAEIFSSDETKHNFRTARLLKAYAEEKGNASILGIKEFEQLNTYLKQARQRFETTYQDFSSEISLYENYGMISDRNGEKTAILKLALDWFRITRITADYGFYARVLDAIKDRISLNAAEQGQQLMRQLEELADKPEYDFGVYSKDAIESLINDQNFTSAEFILNCIRRHDTKEVHDYSVEPFGYFNEFITEHQTNYRAVFGAGKSIVATIADYSGRKDMEKALIYLTNNARKETAGGASMLKSWMPKGGPAKPDDLQKLLSRLGFNTVSIVPEDNGSIESYRVLCKKRTGKVTYSHTIPAFGSQAETEGFRVMCLYGKFGSTSLMDKFRAINTTPKHTLVLLDYALNIEDRRMLARKIKEEKSFSKSFIVIDRVILFYLAKHYTSDDTIIRRFMAVTLPFSYYQPFVEDSDKDMPPELFTGREDILTKIESPEGVNLVYGGRQLGKSALLKMAKHNIDKNANNDRALLVEIKGMDYRTAARLVSQKMIINDILPEGCETDDWNILANHIEKRLMDENPETRINYLLLMLDEADEFIRTSAADDNPPITAIKSLPSSRFKLVMAGLHNLSRFNREMLHGNSTLIHLGYTIVRQFKRPEAIKLLTNTLAYLGFRFDEKVISLILAKTNYYPGLIQFYCQKLLEAMQGSDYAGYNENNTPYYEVSESHIKKVLSDPDFMSKVNEKLEASLFTEEKGHSHYHIIALIFAYLYYDSSTDKKYTIDDIMKVANDLMITRLTTLGKEKVEELINEMWDLNVLSKEDEFYRFATEGFREVLGSKEVVEEGILQYAKEELPS